MASGFYAFILPDLKLRLIIFEYVIEFGLEDREMKLMPNRGYQIYDLGVIMRRLKKFLYILILSAVVAPLCAYAMPQYGDLTIILTGFRNNNGFARMSVANSKQGYIDEKKAYCGIKSRLTNKRVEVVLKNIPYGEYAISAFHDESGTGQIRKNIYGIPLEAYGFSNNMRGKLSPPDYEKVRFLLNKHAVIVTIALKNYP